MNLKVFGINKKSNLKENKVDLELEKKYIEYAQLGLEECIKRLDSNIDGLSNEEVEIRLYKNGKNIVNDKKKKNWYYFFFKSFLDEFIIVLIALGTVSIFLDDILGAIIIYLLAFVSSMIRFVQEFTSYKAHEKLKNMVHSNTDVKRLENESSIEIDVENIVEGDIIELGAGSIIPADLKILESKDLFVSQSIFTGESAPVEKTRESDITSCSSLGLENICFMGTSVISGSAKGIVIKTGKSTYLGTVAEKMSEAKPITNFEIGIKKITNTLIKYMLIVVLAVFAINGIIKGQFVQALFFAISVAVGMTPGMLPMIINVNLSKGAVFLAKKKTIVKNLNSIQNLGSIDILCTDKTGTLTIDNVVLQKYMNVEGKEDIKILEYAFLNSFFSTGIKNLIDRAIIEYGTAHNIKKKLAKYTKIDEIPFDYTRKKMSIVVKSSSGTIRLITKGALEEILKGCSKVKYNDDIVDITEDMIKKINEHANILHKQGMHVIAIAQKHEYPGVDIFNSSHETDMVFIGYVAFLDPPKEDVKDTLTKLKELGINVKVLTGDSPFVTENICKQVGLYSNEILTGLDIDKMTKEQLSKAVEDTNIFARLAPLQKSRVVEILKENGHVVGYMGDGVNDAPSLRTADIGISVDSATDIAKESSDIILLEKSLDVLKVGVIEGRRIYGNIIKYMKMALAGNFGNAFSVLIASIFLPFLPMIPIQILIQNLIYDLTQIGIPFDNVDEEFTKQPKKWDTKDLSRFMNVLGITSSIFDVMTFLALWFILGFSNIASESLFQTGWFVEGLISQVLIVHFIRTSKIPFIESRANKILNFTTLIGIVGALSIPIIFSHMPNFHFVALPAIYYLYLVIIIAIYAIMVQAVKGWYIKKYKNWL